MSKQQNKKNVLKIIEESNPMLVRRTENGYLVLNDKQKEILRQKTFETNKHIFAASTIGQGIKFFQMKSDHPEAFRRYVEKCEENDDFLPYTYLGISDSDGKVLLTE